MITIEDTKEIFVGNGVTTVFSFDFKTNASTDLEVTFTSEAGLESELVLNTDYTVALNANQNTNPGGTITYGVDDPLTADERLTVLRAASATQPTSYTQGVQPSALETKFDNLVMYVQQLKERVARTFGIAVSDDATDLSLGTATQRASKYVKFDEDGELELTAVVEADELTQPVFDSFLTTVSDAAEETFFGNVADAAKEVFFSTTSLVGAAIEEFWKLVNPRTAMEIAAGVTPVTYRYPEGNVLRYGADPTGVDECDTALASALLVAYEYPNGGSVRYPAGEFLHIETVTVVQDRINISGEGPEATRIMFAPDSNGDIMFLFDKVAATSIVNCSLKHLSIYSDDDTFTKTAIQLVDVAEFDLHDIFVGGSVDVDGTSMFSDSGNSCIGLRIYGRQTLSARDIHIQADRPVLLEIDPNTFIDADHFNFHNCYVVANDNPCWEVAQGVSWSNCSWTGYQAWVKGTAGFSFPNTTALGFNPYKIRFENVRSEQGTDDTDYTFDISTTTGLIDDLQIVNCYLDIGRNGIRTSGVMRIALESVTYPSTTGTGLHVTGSASGAAHTRLSIKNSYWQTTSTATLTNMRKIIGFPRGGTTQPISGDAEYGYDGLTQRTISIANAIQGDSYTIAEDAAQSIGPNTLNGYLFVKGHETTAGAIFHLNGTTNSATQVSDIATLFSPTKDTAGEYNIYAESSQYWIQNKRTGQGNRQVKWLLIGTESVANS